MLPCEKYVRLRYAGVLRFAFLILDLLMIIFISSKLLICYDTSTKTVLNIVYALS